MNQKISKHFQTADPILFTVIEKIGDIKSVIAREGNDYFIALCNSIISQQLSTRVGDVIFERFEKLFKNNKITPKQVLKISHEQLRSTGMSNAKARYIKDLAEKVVNKEVHLELLKDISNEEVILELTKIKGIGRWTAEMFLMFTLGREDIFSHGDLGLKNAIKNIYSLENPTREQIEIISLKWSPYRTYACRVLWMSLEKP